MFQRGCGGTSHYHCVQYPDECDSGTMTGFTIPLQKTYLANYETAGAKAGNGGFFFSCYLGAYFNSNFASTDPGNVPRPMSGEPPRYRCHLGYILLNMAAIMSLLAGIWNQISVGGKTMQQAISAWWKSPSTAPAAVEKDCVWTTTGKLPAPGWPPKTDALNSSSLAVAATDEARDGEGAPTVPWYTSHCESAFHLLALGSLLSRLLPLSFPPRWLCRRWPF